MVATKHKCLLVKNTNTGQRNNTQVKASKRAHPLATIIVTMPTAT